jgi:hypothetical protein
MTGKGDQPYEMPRIKSDLARIALRAEKEAARRRAMWEGRPPVHRRAPKRRRADNSAVPLHAVISELFADVIRDVAGGDLPAVVADWDNLAGPLDRYIIPTSFDPANRDAERARSLNVRTCRMRSSFVPGRRRSSAPRTRW